MSPPLLDTMDAAKRLAMEGKTAREIASELDLHLSAATRIVCECEQHKAKLKAVMEAS